MRANTVEDIERKLIPNSFTGCATWGELRDGDGYGLVSFQGKLWRVHRLIWTHNMGPIPKGMKVCHNCDITSCGELTHLFLGTSKQNTQDAIAKGRMSLGELNGRSRLTTKQVIQMRSIRIKLGATYQEISDLFELPYSTIADVLAGKKWKHLLNSP